MKLITVLIDVTLRTTTASFSLNEHNKSGYRQCGCVLCCVRCVSKISHPVHMLNTTDQHGKNSINPLLHFFDGFKPTIT